MDREGRRNGPWDDPRVIWWKPTELYGNPKKDGTYLITGENAFGVRECFIGEYDTFKREWYERGVKHFGHRPGVLNGITAWACLPEPALEFGSE